MSKLRYFLIIVFLLIISRSAFASTCHSLASMRWLLGTWSSTTPTMAVREQWSAISASTFEGKGWTESLPLGQQLSSESLRIVAMSGEFFYLAKVAENNYPVAFKLTQCQQGKLVFENPTHDFPTSLTYTLINENQLSVEVGGKAGDGFTINYQRSI